MAPTTVRNLEHFVHDLRHSRYFQAWAVLSLATFIIFWIGFGVYVNHVEMTSDVFATGFEPEFALEFPYYHFRLLGFQDAPAAIVLSSVNCLWNATVPLAIQPCLGYPAFANGMANCFAVTTHNSSFSAWASLDASGKPDPFVPLIGTPDLFAPPSHDPSRIYCNFSVDWNVLGSTPNWVAWEIETPTGTTGNYNYGDNSYGSIWFPNENVQWVLLEQFKIDGVTYWDRYRLSHLPALPLNDTAGNALFQTVTIMDTTTVTFFQQFSFGYHSWNGLADIGGLAFALYIMKVTAMVFIGLFLENDSIFLGGKEAAPDNERQPIVQ